jgi:hypothetical protein
MPAEPIRTTATAVPKFGGAGWVVIDPRYQRRLTRRELFAAADFIDLPGEVVSGHADRHVVRVVIGRGLNRLECYLKREHRVPWRERLRNFCDGFGWVSKSEREVRILHGLHRAGIAAPRWLAYGEDGQGRAFVLIRAVADAMDLRTYLTTARPDSQRRALARRLGAMLARIHAAGFDCPDLSSKHVLVRSRKAAPVIIDWQRANAANRPQWGIRVRELAALHATLADGLAGPRNRITCLRAYLTIALGRKPALRPWVSIIVHRAAQLLRRRGIRDARRPPLPGGQQRLRWVDGERLVVTRSVWRATRGRLPEWLVAASHDVVAEPTESSIVWGRRSVVLRQFPPASAIRRWWNALRGRHEIAAGPRLGGLLFHLERIGTPGPRPLAFGQRPDGGSFIVIRPIGWSSEPEA